MMAFGFVAPVNALVCEIKLLYTLIFVPPVTLISEMSEPTLVFDNCRLDILFLYTLVATVPPPLIEIPPIVAAPDPAPEEILDISRTYRKNSTCST